jgi:ADP-ribosyl-[dinitrogen reductase] hydrolase
MQNQSITSLDTLIGMAVGDALGVPVEFKSRAYLEANPITTMLGFGTHHQPVGTWSDDSSLAFCLADALCKGYDLEAIADWFVAWRDAKAWTPHGKVFDIGVTTSEAIRALKSGVSPTLSGIKDENSNGNGSLMRILPLAFHIRNESIEKRFQKIKEVSSITHAHIRSVLACFIYIEFALILLQEKDKQKAYQAMQVTVNEFLESQPIASQKEMNIFDRILKQDISEVPAYHIRSSGYVVHTLEASLWCLLIHDNYVDTTLSAVNLGEDTDTTGAVVGGLAGLWYGMANIPEAWVAVLARRDDIFDLAKRFDKTFYS